MFYLCNNKTDRVLATFLNPEDPISHAYAKKDWNRTFVVSKKFPVESELDVCYEFKVNTDEDYPTEILLTNGVYRYLVGIRMGSFRWNW